MRELDVLEMLKQVGMVERDQPLYQQARVRKLQVICVPVYEMNQVIVVNLLEKSQDELRLLKVFDKEHNSD